MNVVGVLTDFYLLSLLYRRQINLLTELVVVPEPLIRIERYLLFGVSEVEVCPFCLLEKGSPQEDLTRVYRKGSS